MDGAFYGLDSIEELYLDRNEVKRSIGKLIQNKTEHFVTVFNDQVVTVNKGWLYGLTKLKQLSLAHNQVCPLLLQQDALALPCLLKLIMISL